jgi:putative ABC transport system ATP-binding protein
MHSDLNSKSKGKSHMSREIVVRANHVYKTYLRGSYPVPALHDVSIDVARGEFVVIMGASGSGKSTLLQILGGLDRVTAGTVEFAGTELSRLSDAEMALFRRRRLGFVFQFFHLLPTLSVRENVLLPLSLDGRADRTARAYAADLLGSLGLGARIDHKAYELSGGEMQRVAIARALVTDPVAVLADEPTGNLDSRTGTTVLELLVRLAEEHHVACIMVTHDARAAQYGTRIVQMRDGRVVTDWPVADSGMDVSGVVRAA